MMKEYLEQSLKTAWQRRADAEVARMMFEKIELDENTRQKKRQNDEQIALLDAQIKAIRELQEAVEREEFYINE